MALLVHLVVVFILLEKLEETVAHFTQTLMHLKHFTQRSSSHYNCVPVTCAERIQLFVGVRLTSSPGLAWNLADLKSTCQNCRLAVVI